MNVTEAIHRAAPVIALHGDNEPVILTVWLIRAGLSRKQAHDAQRFIPLAFAREIMNGTGILLPDTYVRVESSNQEERALNDEPFFAEATRLAPSIASALGTDAFTAVAVQSSELQAFNQALHAGSQPEDLIVGPPFVQCEVIEEKPERPWWKFWG